MDFLLNWVAVQSRSPGKPRLVAAAACCMLSATPMQPETPARPGPLDRFAVAVGQIIPDALTSCVILLMILAAAAFGFGAPSVRVIDAYYRGLWMLLPFTMQMTLIIVLSTALSSSPAVRKTICALAALPRSRRQVIVLTVLLACCCAYLYWGLALTVLPLIAVALAREAENKGIAVDFPFLLGVGYAAGSVWQFGLSASAPLLVATPGHFLQSTIGIVPLSTTIWSAAALLHIAVFTVAVIAAGCLLIPRQGRPVSSFPQSLKLVETAAEPVPPVRSYSERLELHSVFTLTLCGALATWLYYHFVTKRLGLDINALNTILFLLTLLVHCNVRGFTRAVERAVSTSWPVIILYHLYAGVAGLVQFTDLGEKIAGLSTSVSTPATFPFYTALISTVFACFIPSSGGQWAIQGFVTSKIALALGVSVQRGLLALSVGDQMGNLITPFWYIVVAAVARIDFRDFFGYGIFFAVLWFLIGVVVFTWAPC